MTKFRLFIRMCARDVARMCPVADATVFLLHFLLSGDDSVGSGKRVQSKSRSNIRRFLPNYSGPKMFDFHFFANLTTCLKDSPADSMNLGLPKSGSINRSPIANEAN